MTDSKTANNSENPPGRKNPGKPFVKGDPRINKKGRPRSIGMLRELAQQISHEVAQVDQKPVILDGHKVTVAEAILRTWASSHDFRKQNAFMEYAFGKVTQPVDVTTAGEKVEFIVTYAEDKDNPEEAAPASE